MTRSMGIPNIFILIIGTYASGTPYAYDRAVFIATRIA